MTKEEYFDQMALTWDTRSRCGRQTIERILSFTDIKEGFGVIDLGTGTGILLPYLLSLVGDRGHVYAVDISGEMLKKAKERLLPLLKNVSFLKAGAEDLPLTEACVNAVICFAAFPHFCDKVAALREMFRVLKPGGSILIAHDKGRDEINHMHRHACDVISDDLLPDPVSMRSLLDETGFSEEVFIDRRDMYLILARQKAAMPRAGPSF